MKPEAEQPNALRQRMKGAKQRLPSGNECRKIRYWRSEALRPGDDGEVAELDLQCHGAPGDLGAFHAVPGITGDPIELGGEMIRIAQVLVEGPLRADRLVRPVGPHLALVDPAADAPVPRARAAKLRLERRQSPFAKVG